MIETELLKHPSGGRRFLSEIKEILATQNMAVGMQVEGGFPRGSRNEFIAQLRLQRGEGTLDATKEIFKAAWAGLAKIGLTNKEIMELRPAGTGQRSKPAKPTGAE